MGSVAHQITLVGTRGTAADEAGDSSAVKGNPVAAVEQAVCTGVRNLRALTRVSLRPICTGGLHDSGADGRARRRRAGCACLWRADACVQGVPVARKWACATPLPQGGAKARSSARGQRDVAVCLTSSAASAFVDADQVRSAHCQGGRTL